MQNYAEIGLLISLILPHVSTMTGYIGQAFVAWKWVLYLKGRILGDCGTVVESCQLCFREYLTVLKDVNVEGPASHLVRST